FAYAGIAVVLLAATAALVFLPALLAALGHRVDKWTVLPRRRQAGALGDGFWHRLAMLVMRRPLAIAGVVIAVLLALGAPFLHIRFSLPDDRVLPTSAPGRQVQDEIRANFASNEANVVTVVAAAAPDLSAVDGYATRLSTLP